MGNHHRFRLSDMIPSAWFYKLKKDMAKTRNQNSHHPIKKNNPPTSSFSSLSFSSSSSTSSSSLPSSTATIEKTVIPQQQSKTRQPNLLSHQRKSYYFTRDLPPPPQSTGNNPKSSDAHFPDFPRKSSKQRHSRNRASNRPSPKPVTTPVSGGCLCRATIESSRTNPDSTFEDYPNSPIDSSLDFQSLLPELGSANDIVIDADDKLLNTKFDEFNTICKLELPPIVTKNPPQDMKKTKERNDRIEANKFCKTSAKFGERRGQESRHRITTTCREQRNSPVKRLSVSSPGVRLRTNSPRIASRKVQAHGRKSWSSNSGSRARRSSLSESLAVVKSSADPQRDFRESMVEMILENNIKASKELEDLLACYLQLNSDEYHELIIKVFKQIWFDLVDVGMN